jgi:hypothetical protein
MTPHYAIAFSLPQVSSSIQNLVNEYEEAAAEYLCTAFKDRLDGQVRL